MMGRGGYLCTPLGSFTRCGSVESVKAEADDGWYEGVEAGKSSGHLLWRAAACSVGGVTTIVHIIMPLSTPN
jgi:hypothetical protein